MKYLFFLLLVFNIVFYLWETGFGREKNLFDRVELSLPDETGRITLIKELPKVPHRSSPPITKGAAIPEQAKAPSNRAGEKKARTEQEPTAQLAPKPADPYCFQLGPFRTEASARAALESVRGRVPEAEVVSGLAGTITGYWVLYPKAETIEAAKINRNILMKKGIREMWLFDKGELAGAISLGLYQTLERAEIAQKRFFEQNLKVEVVPRVARSPASWLQLHWEGEREDLEDVVAGIQGRNQGPQLQNCE